LAQGGVGELFDRAQRVIGWNARFDVDQRTEFGLGSDLSTHAQIDNGVRREFKTNATFSTSC